MASVLTMMSLLLPGPAFLARRHKIQSCLSSNLWRLSDAAAWSRALIFVVVEEVIPETQQDKYTDIATLGFIGGFIVMMILDVALG